jgi:hypothetical protein
MFECMQNLRRRLALLERSLPPVRGNDMDDETMDRALAAVSAEDREVLMRIGQRRLAVDGEQSTERTDSELAALDAFAPIAERECRRRPGVFIGRVFKHLPSDSGPMGQR